MKTTTDTVHVTILEEPLGLLRPPADTTAQNSIRDLILEAYAEHEAAPAEGVLP